MQRSSKRGMCEAMCETAPTFDYRHELGRKAIHFLSALCPLVYAFISRELMLWLAIPVTALVLIIDILRQVHPGLRSIYDRRWGRLMRGDEHRRLSGASHLMIAMVLCVLLFPRPVALAAMLFLSVSDAVASLVGIRVGGRRWLGKSLAGSTAFLGSALVLALLCMRGDPLAAVIGALVATVVEALPLRIGRARIDDNISVPLVSGAVMWALYGA